MQKPAAGTSAAGMTRREAYEAAVRKRSNRIALISTICVVLAVVILVPLAPG